MNPLWERVQGICKVTRSLVDRSNISYYGVVSAMYGDRYVLNANIRFDGSNLFGSNPKYRYLPLWSVSGRWIISNESFLSDNEILSNLALRASYGLRGNIVEDSSHRSLPRLYHLMR